MTQPYRKTLLAGAIAALLATPMIAAGEVTRDGAQAPNVTQAGQQWRDETTTGRTVTGESTDQPESSAQPQSKGLGTQESGLSELDEPVGYPAEEYTTDGASPRPAETATGAQVSDNPLYSRSFDNLNGMDVVDSASEKIGKLTGVVLSPDRQSAHAVISSGGFLGMGTRETLVSFSDLKLIADHLQMNTTEEAFKARSEFQADDYIKLDGDRPIRESIVDASAFAPGYGSDQRRDTLPRGTGESEGGATTPPWTTESR
jgi:sporulation protein YlmC with PRC-barrel domain